MSPQPNTRVYATNSLATVVNMQYNYPAAPNNNGKACLATDALTGEQAVYSYDSLNRLSSAAAYTPSGTPSTNCAERTGSTVIWTESYSLDGFGNLTNKIGTGGGPNVPIGVSATNNQITDGAGIDASGLTDTQYDALLLLHKLGHILGVQQETSNAYNTAIFNDCINGKLK